MTENEAKRNNSANSSYTKNIPHTETCEKCLYIKSRCKCNKSDANAGCIGINEAQEYLLNRYLVVGSPVNPPKEECEKHNAVLNIAIQALEEIQQYRAMERRLQNIYGECDGLLETVVQHLEKHENIKLPDNIIKAILLTDEEVDKWEQLKSIGTIEEFKALKEKATPKKGIPYTSSNNHKFVECPSCHKDMDLYYDFCQYCGQSVDWGKSKT